MQKYTVLSPDGIPIELNAKYETIEDCEKALDAFVKRYEAQGYYSTFKNNERVRIPISEIKQNCKIWNI